VTVQRVMGTEVEYGVSLPGQPNANAMLLSAQVVNAYSSALPAGRARRASWDFEEESPLRDARGFDLGGSGNVSQEFIDAEEDTGMANVILPNGARLYVDHAHPEYSSPEVTNPLDAVRWDKAGELVMLEAVRRVATMPGVSTPINLYKNNTDNKGASYGAHENYLCNRETPFSSIVRHLIPFFVTRQVMCGAGRVGRGQDGRTSGFQISQRADFFEVEVGLETTLKRPIVNTRDEPHADAERYRRLHVIIGDANMSEISTYLKVGTTALVLAMIEANVLAEDLAIIGPVRELHEVSHDHTLRHRIQLADGRTISALDLQGEYLDRARKYVDDRFGDDADEQTRDVLARWEATLARLGTDPMSLANQLDWVAKLRLLEGYRDRDHLDWDASALQLVDLQYSDVRPEKGSITGSCPGAPCRRCSTLRASRRRSTRRPRTPAPTSGASACAATEPRWLPPHGTRSSST
jgi:proteasome accessory factor A